jgi:hypothetical protein
MKRIAQSTVLLMAVLASPAFAQEASREDFREFCQVMQGRWVGAMTSVAGVASFGKKGEELVAHGEVTLAENGNALIDKFYAGNGSGISLIVYDAGARQIKALLVNSGGGVGQCVFYKREGKWIYQGALSNPDGTKSDFLVTITIADDGNTQTWIGRPVMGGTMGDELKDVWRRVSK